MINWSFACVESQNQFAVDSEGMTSFQTCFTLDISENINKAESSVYNGASYLNLQTFQNYLDLEMS
jgi:hypothetical protein